MIAAALASSPPPLPGFLNALSGTLQHYGLWAIGLLITLEDFGVPVPGETILIAGAIFAGAGKINVAALAVVAFVAAVTGDNIGFAIGHFGGRALALRFGKYVFLTEERLNKAERFFDRRGSIVITFARFVEGLRQANGIIAGITGMHWLRFLIFNAIGAALWVGTWVTIGYFAGNNISTVYHYITLYSYYVLAGLVVLIVGYIVWRRRRRRRRVAAASQTEEAPAGSRASEAAEPSPDQNGPAHAVPDEQETAQITPTEHVAGPSSVPARHAPEQPSRRQGS
ncbi:MAG TPA: DedA family protein [Trebonia sp.]|jgi:membrane protein DedA with SNARE-associated domain